MAMLSPDGRWRWDGAQWVPVPREPPRPMAARWAILIVAGAIAVLLLAGLGLALLTLGMSHLTVQGAVTTTP